MRTYLRKTVWPYLPFSVICFLQKIRQGGFRGHKWTAVRFCGDYKEFQKALSDATGYDVQSVADTYAMNFKNRQTTYQVPHAGDRTLQILSALSIIFSRRTYSKFRVLDVGGATGSYFYDIKRFFPHIEFTWTVVETGPVVDTLSKFDEQGLNFIRSGDDYSRSYDLVLMSGYAQCVEYPHRDIRHFCSLGEFSLLTRTPVLIKSGLRDKDRLTMQKVQTESYSISFPAWFFGESTLEKTLSEVGDVILRYDVPQDCPILDGYPVVYKGYLIHRKES